MEPRLIVGYGLLLLLAGAIAGIWLYRRRRIHKDRMMRWGTTLSPGQIRRRGRIEARDS